MKDFDLPSVSIIVSNFNGLGYLKRTLPSLLSLNYKNYEVIVVDNMSADLSMEYVQGLENVKFISSGVVGGKNFGLNKGIENAKGEFLLFLDCDVKVDDSNLLVSLVQRYYLLDSVGLISLALINEGEDNVYFYGSYLSKISFIKKNPRIKVEDLNIIDSKKVVGVQGASFFGKKSIFDEIGYFDTTFSYGGEDVDVGIRSISKGYSNYIYTEILLTHIGMNERSDNKKFISKLSNGTAGLYSTMIKNYSITNLLVCMFIFIVYEFLRNAKDSILRKEVKIIYIYFKTLILLFEKRKKLIITRKINQKSRIIKRDVFFKLTSKI